VGGGAQSIVTADLGNGHQDIVVLGSPPGDASSVSVLLGNGNGTFKPAITTKLLPGANAIAVGDFNHDGKLDLVVTNPVKNLVEVLRGNGDGTFQPNPLILTAGAGASSVAVGDFQHNGNLDLAVTNSVSNTVSVFLGNGNGTFQAVKNITLGNTTVSGGVVSMGAINLVAGPVAVAAADLGNGQVDLVVANNASNSVSVLLGNGDGTFRRGQTIKGVANSQAVMVADFNHDGKPDVIIEQIAGGDAAQTSETVLLGNGDGTFKPPISRFLGQGLIGLAVGDFNGDGKTDIAAADGFGTTVDVFSGNGNGTFAATPSDFQTGGGPFGVATGDFNGDGRPDLAVANSIGNTVGVLLNTSGRAGTTTTLRVSVPSAAVGQKETLTATVTSPAGKPSGTVTFFDGTRVLGTAPLNAAGQATLTVSLSLGSHSLKASFGGNSAFDPSTSAVVIEPVHATPLFDGSVVQGTSAPNANGKAASTTPFATPGGHRIKAVSDSDSLFAAALASLLEQVS
jgi:hypothetical protein